MYPTRAQAPAVRSFFVNTVSVPVGKVSPLSGVQMGSCERVGSDQDFCHPTHTHTHTQMCTHVYLLLLRTTCPHWSDMYWALQDHPEVLSPLVASGSPL